MWRGESDSGRFHSLSILRDTKREAERLGLPLGMVADPVGMPTERGLAVLHYAIEQGKGAEFLESAGKLHHIDHAREYSQQSLAALNTQLEQRVIERTAELKTTNAKLTKEVELRIEIEDESRRLSLTDELTGLHNRRSFFLLAEQLLRNSRRNGLPCLLFFFDLDGLKKINDAHGHEAGDLAIMASAQVLKAAFRENDVVARIGGDEFVALAVDIGEPTELISARIRALVDEFNSSDHCRYPIGLSIGAICCSPQELKPLAELLANADALMYADKQQRKQARQTT